MITPVFKDLFFILNKKHLSLHKRIQLAFTFLLLKIRRRHYLHKNYQNAGEVINVSVVGYQVSTDNIADLFATFYEIFVTEEYKEVINGDDDVVFDVGANIGLATIYFDWLMPRVEIVGFEMDTDTYGLYQKNLFSNKLDNVISHQVGIGETNMKMDTYGSRRATTIVPDRASKLPEKAEPTRKRTVEVRKLSEFLQAYGAVTLKLDIEGAEIGVIKELSNSSSFDKINRIVMEFHHPDESFGQVKDLLEAAGFVIKKFNVQANGYFMVNGYKN
tara:strand:- start:12620 stop:13441 length:822 start_codon:yes stop_codon:yes gene_type:complete